MMALKSNIHMEILWALNALTVMLYDDSINPLTLSPEFLNVITEHFRASLSLVFPNAFPLDDSLNSESDNNENTESTIWDKILEDAKKRGETIKTKVKLPPAMKNSLGKDLNSVSRGGIKIISKDVEMPTKLKEWKQPESPTTTSDKTDKNASESDKAMMSYEERQKLGLPTEFSLKVAESTKEFVEQICIKSDKVKYSKWDDPKEKHFEYDDDVQPKKLSLAHLDHEIVSFYHYYYCIILMSFVNYL